MKRTRLIEEQITGILKEHQVGLGVKVIFPLCQGRFDLKFSVWV